MRNYNETRKRNPKLVISAVTVITAVMLLGTTAISTLTTPGSVFAYRNTQATSQANDCGNGAEGLNVGCQNTGSQIQGDKNTVSLSSQQTFPGADLCVACFDSLTSEQRTDFEEVLALLTGGTIEQLCETFAELSPQDKSRITGLLISVLGIETASEIILCLEEVFGPIPLP
ncbi:MAG: hypothetical protein ACRD8Z_13855 [Nitrososphaeraceae archaeon]